MTAQAMSAGTAETHSGSGRQPASAVRQDAPNPLYQEGYSMTDTTDQQAVTVAQIEAARRYIRGEDDAIAWAIQAAIDASPGRLASVSSASAEGERRATEHGIADEVLAVDLCAARGFERRGKVDGFSAYCAVVDGIRSNRSADDRLREALNKIADLGACGNGKTPAYKLLQNAIDIATGAL